MPIYPNTIHSITFVFNTKESISIKKFKQFLKKVNDPDILQATLDVEDNNVLYLEYKVRNILTIDFATVEANLLTLIEEYMELWR